MGLAPTVLGERFELGARIGEGSLSVVHAARDLETGREVAIKIGQTSMEDRRAVRRRFDREAAALAVMASPHVVDLLAAGTLDDGWPYLVLERLRGRDLRAVFEQVGPLKPSLVARFIGQAAAALELAHGLGIVHRDLKPANLYLHEPEDERPLVKVLDFGLVVDLVGPGVRERDAFGGTPLFMSPEQVRGQLSRIGPQTDVWALGVVSLWLLTGDSCWSGSSSDEIMDEIVSSPIVPPSRRWSWLPPAFDAWFARSTERVPERRFASVVEQATQLSEALRGVSAPERDELAEEMAGASTITARTPTPSIVRLASQDTAVIGRQVELVEIAGLLEPGRVVTLTGTAGIGKTRMAQVVCQSEGKRFFDGAWFVPLAAGAGQLALLSPLADALGLAPDTARSLLQNIIASVRDRQMLIALDAVEQVSDVGDVVEELLRACPSVSWLVTSRLPLGVAGEHCVGITPLDMPPAGTMGAAEARTFSAVELFVERAKASRPEFSLNAENVDDVVAICRAVDGFPLGIELAAVQMQSAEPADVRAALERPGPRPGRHGERAAVRAAVTWSYSLLSEEEQAMLRYLAVLPAGLTFEQVRRRLGAVSARPASTVMRLVQSQLLQWTSARERRLTMLATVRGLCLEIAEAAGETDELWRFARAHLDAVASWDPDSPQDAWLAQVDAEHDNVRGVLAHLLDYEPAAAIGPAGRLAWYWYLRGQYAEGTTWLEASIDCSGVRSGPELIRALNGAGRLALLSCRYRRAGELLARARDLANEEGDQRGEATAVQLLGSVARELGDYELARAQHVHSLALWHVLGDRREVARANNYLVFAAWLADEGGTLGGDNAEWCHGGAEMEFRELDDPEGIVWSLLNLGVISHYRNDSNARVVLEEAFAESIASRFTEGIAWSLNFLGLSSLRRGEHLQARAQLAASLRVHRRVGDLWRCASVLEALAAVAVTAEHPARGAVYLGAAEAIRKRIATPVPGCERRLFDLTHERGVAALGDAFHNGIARGKQTDLDRVIELAREVSDA